MNNNQSNIPFFEKYKEYRKSKNISITNIFENTKINIKYIKAIEEGDFNCIPKAYRKLFIKTYTKYIGISTEEYLDEYENFTNAKYGKTLKNKTPEFISTKKGISNSSQSESTIFLSESYFIRKKKITLILFTAFLILLSLFLLKLYNSDNIPSDWHNNNNFNTKTSDELLTCDTKYSQNIIFKIKYHNHKNALFANGENFILSNANDIKEILFHKNEIKEFKLLNSHAILMLNDQNIDLKSSQDMIKIIYSAGKLNIQYYKNPDSNFIF